MIYSEKNYKRGLAAFILVFSLLMGVSQAFAADSNDVNDINDANNPIIGTDTNAISFAEGDVAKRFYVWNEGTGLLKYRVDINGPNASYFYLDKSSGESNDINDKKRHLVSIDVDQWPDTNLIANVVITNESNDLDISYISLVALAPPEEPNEPPDSNHGPDTSTVIGKSTGRIGLTGGVISRRFQIWNKGTETLNYTLTIDGNDADYFTLDSEDGSSEGLADKQTHTVDVNYQDLHNTTLYAWIEITDDNDNVAYIDLSATETAATRISYISIEQGINYQDSAEANDFFLYIETDDTVDEINFITPETPEGEEYLISDYNESEDGSVRYWIYPEEPGEDVNFADYGDGDYTIGVTYEDSDVAQTTVNFGIPNKPGTIVWPTQIPVLTFPDDGPTVSPVRFEWKKCVDVNADAVRLVLENQDSENSIEREYSKGTMKSSAIDLETGEWLTELSFGRWYQAENGDGIEIKVGKCTRSYSDFEIMKWFGTFGKVRNHPLKLTDCFGAEVTFNLTGGGWGEIENDDCNFTSIILHETTEKSNFTIKTAGGSITTVGSIDVPDGGIKAIMGRKVNLEENITIDGGTRSIVLNNISGSISIGEYGYDDGSDSPKIITCVLKFNEVDDLTLTSDTPIRNLKATHWNSGSLTAPWISNMTIDGDFGTDITTGSDDNPKGVALKTAKIAGVVGGNWDITGNCGTIQIAESTDIADANIEGNIGTLKVTGNKKTALPAVLSGTWGMWSVKTITAGGIENCSISASQQSTEGQWAINKIENKGIKNKAFCFINSNITADHIGTATLAYPKYSNGDNGTFGLKASLIDKLTIVDSIQKRTWVDLEPANNPIQIGDLEINPPDIPLP